ncbi:hypothetical protein IJJ27_03030 [bacterium]|nr:hypothetical protein [bacterium]MBQ6436508.1 hypothetical protein [bacterium]
MKRIVNQCLHYGCLIMALVVVAQAIFVVHDSNGVISVNQQVSDLQAENDSLRTQITILESRLSSMHSIAGLQANASELTGQEYEAIDSREVVRRPKLASLE